MYNGSMIGCKFSHAQTYNAATQARPRLRAVEGDSSELGLPETRLSHVENVPEASDTLRSYFKIHGVEYNIKRF